MRGSASGRAGTTTATATPNGTHCVCTSRSPELDPFANPTSVYVDTADPDALHAEWLPLGFWLMQVITPELAAEARERWARGEPVGRMNERVEDKPWRVREFALLDLDNNQLRFGRPG